MNRRQPTRQNEKGSALLVSLMVIVGLSLLGLGFVAVSETESAISVNERNYTQTLQVAEAGARVVAEWFNAPQWALDNGLMPGNTVAIKQQRENATYTGYYKQTLTDKLCDLPYDKSDDQLFGVDGDSADIVITYTNAAAFLDQFNTRLFNDFREGGRVTEIRIYAPPVVGGDKHTTAAGLQFWDRNVGTRYGLATIMVTAVKTKDGEVTGQVLARRTMRAVVAPLPLPGADGPLQSGRGTGTTGNFRVHWGQVISNEDVSVKRINTALPWRNTREIIPYEEGYAEPINDPLVPDYFYELLEKGFEDPWFEVRARGTATPPGGSPATVPGSNQLWLYSTPDNVENAEGTSGFSAHFQNQNVDSLPTNQRNTKFFRPEYRIWKQIALAGAGQQGIYYLRYVSGNDHTSIWRNINGEQREWRKWVNIHDGGEEGIFFFDTLTGGDPQLPNSATNTAILTPEMKIASAAGNPFEMRGFFYMNMLGWGTTGLQNPGTYYAYPAEPYRDIGYHHVDLATLQLQCTNAGGVQVACASDPAAKWLAKNDQTNQWDYQDVNGDGKFNLVVELNSAAIAPPGIDTGPIAVNSVYLPVPYFDGCVIDVTCSEPHEPYLNLTYSTTGNAIAVGGANPPVSVVVGWEQPGSETRLPKVMSGASPIACSAASDLSECTSNYHDDTGALVQLGNDGPILEGIIYNEGDYIAAGNATYYGALLFQGTVTGAGTPYIFFDDSLKSGKWADKFKNLPRTVITALETDQ